MGERGDGPLHRPLTYLGDGVGGSRTGVNGEVAFLSCVCLCVCYGLGLFLYARWFGTVLLNMDRVKE